MRIRIVSSNPLTGEKGIAHLVGKEFEVKKADEDGKYIELGETGLYLIHDDELEIVEEVHPQ